MELKGRIAVITGAAGAIGSEAARLFSSAGASLCLTDRDHDALTRLASDLNGDVATFDADITTHESRKALFDFAVGKFGGVDILVNVAGTVSFGSADTLSEAEWDRVMAVNLKSVFFCCQMAMRIMRPRRYGRIINIGSVIGKNGGNARPWIDPSEQEVSSNVAYGISKAGIHAMTIFLSKEGARDSITVNAVAPGPVASAMTTQFPDRLKALIPAGRMGKASDVARACLFLASENADFITGEILDINGGMWGD